MIKNHLEKHLPTWKSFGWNILLMVLTPTLAYILLDLTGITKGFLVIFPFEMFEMIFSEGAVHIFACAALHFLYNAMKDLSCLIKHDHDH